ncbi:amidohydrolase [Tindallia magadiensis]|uniref:Amidohydrolase n=1 Tax=Tindallia magadiensis TaxID=69895 RepID=A0A1I3GL94_9FIRM|nr:M20 family metallopeptidase [Tindallia magadiensis]SFI24170.1 amidohydrolase [Tindallia magadiensis]
MLNTINWWDEIDAMDLWLRKIRQELHQWPELGTEEWQTNKKITTTLKEIGVEDIKTIAGTGVVALIAGKKPGKTIALRADMDALPIQEETKVTYASKHKGIMHACGHDAHMTILLGVAKALKKYEPYLKGNVKLMFQPAEETVGGAERMIAEGVLQNPEVDMVYGLHVAPELEVGTVGIRYGQMNASSDTIEIKIKGKNTHGAYPHRGVDAILIAGEMITGLQSIVSRNIDPRDSAVLSFGKIQGGSQGNIIADEVVLTGTLRTFDPEVRSRAKEKIIQMVQTLPKAFGGEGDISIEPGYSALINHKETTTIVENQAIKALGKENVQPIETPSLGVEDFSFFLQEKKGTFFRLGVGNREKGITAPGHSKEFNIDEDSLRIGVYLQIMNTLSSLEEIEQ